MTESSTRTPSRDRRTARGLTRAEAKALTRSRLLDAALAILGDEGEAGLTTTSVTRRAGIAQSSFYVHFADMDDLVHELIDSLVIERRRVTRQARRDAWAAPGDEERFRDTFRVPIAQFVAQPELFRLLMRVQYDRDSPLGEWSRSVLADTHAALVEDLHLAGLPMRTETDRHKAAMVADGIMALTHSMTLGHLDGRYPDVEEIVDVLVAFSWGYFPMLEPDAPGPG